MIFRDIVNSLGGDIPADATMFNIAGAMLIGYGAARAGASIFSELRNAVFAKVAQSAVRQVALRVFQHVLTLDMKFHMSRETGGLQRAIDRGTK